MRVRVTTVATDVGAEERVGVRPGATQIPEGMFVGRDDIAAAAIPETVMAIGAEAFAGCASLASMMKINLRYLLSSAKLPPEHLRERRTRPCTCGHVEGIEREILMNCGAGMDKELRRFKKPEPATSESYASSLLHPLSGEKKSQVNLLQCATTRGLSITSPASDRTSQ